jgi:hypothetical protein
LSPDRFAVAGHLYDARSGWIEARAPYKNIQATIEGESIDWRRWFYDFRRWVMGCCAIVVIGSFLVTFAPRRWEATEAVPFAKPEGETAQPDQEAIFSASSLVQHSRGVHGSRLCKGEEAITPPHHSHVS